MPTSFEILCDYIREQIDTKRLNTIRDVKTALGLNATIDLNNLSKTVLTNGISKVKDDETITLTYAGILIEIVMFYVKNQKNYEKQLSALTKYIERLKNKKFTLAETIKILKKLGLEQSDFYKTVTNKDTYKNICESAKGLLQKVDMEKITDYGIDSKDKANITSAIEKVGSETEVTDTDLEVTDTDLEVKDLEELLQILENIKATCKDETIGDPETLLSELNLLLPETPIESLKNEIEYLRLVIKNDYSVSEQQKQEVLQKCSETTKQKLNKAENRIINRLNDFKILGLNESPKPTGPQNRMAVNPAKIKAAQRKNLALMQKINTAYHEALEKVGNDKSKIDEITTSILDKLKGTLNGSEELSYYQGEYNPEYRGSNLIEINDCYYYQKPVQDIITLYTQSMNNDKTVNRNHVAKYLMSKNIRPPVVFTNEGYGGDGGYIDNAKSLLFNAYKPLPCTVIPVRFSINSDDSYNPTAIAKAMPKIEALADDLNDVLQSSETDKLKQLKEAYNKHTSQKKLTFRDGYTYYADKSVSFKTKNIYESTANEVLNNYATWHYNATEDQKLMITSFIISSIVPRVAFDDNSKEHNDFVNDVKHYLYNPIPRDQKKTCGTKFHALILLAKDVQQKLKYFKYITSPNNLPAKVDSCSQNHRKSTPEQLKCAEIAREKLASWATKQNSDAIDAYLTLANTLLDNHLPADGSSKSILSNLDEYSTKLASINTWVTEQNKIIEKLEKAMDNPKEALNYVGSIPLSWKNGKIPTIGSQRKPQPGQNKAPTQPQPTPQPTPTPTNVQTPTNQNPQVQQYQSGQQTVVQQPANPIIQQPPQQMQYQQQTVQPQANAQQPVLKTPTQPMQGPPIQYLQTPSQAQQNFQQYYPGQQMYPPYQQNYYPQAQQFYSNPQQMAYQPPIQYPPKSAVKQNPHQQGQGAKPTKPSHQLHDSKIIQMKKKTVKEAKENMQKNLTELSQQINATWTNVRKLEERINTLAQTKGFDDQHQNYLSKLGPYLKEKLRQLDTTYNEAKKYFEQSKTVRIYGMTDPAKLQTAQTAIANANDWTTKSLTGLKNFKAELTEIETTLDKEYSQMPTGQSSVPDQKDEQPLETMEQANSAEKNQQNDDTATENAQNQQPKQDTTNGAGGENATEERKEDESENKTEEQNTEENKKHEEDNNTTEEQKADEKDKHQEEKGEDDTSGTSSSNPANDTKDPSSIPNSEPSST